MAVGAAVRPVSAGLSSQPIFNTIGGSVAVDLEAEKLEATRRLHADQLVTLEIDQRVVATKLEAEEFRYTRRLAEATFVQDQGQDLDQKGTTIDHGFDLVSVQSWIGATGELRVVAEKEGYRVEVTEPLELGRRPWRSISPWRGSPRSPGASSGGAPVSDAEVAVAALAEDRTLPASATQARTDEQGRFSFPTLPEGDYLLRVSAAGYQSQTTVVRRGGAIALRLQASGSARVLVLRSGAGSGTGGDSGNNSNNNGAPIEGMEVEARRGAWVVARATSGADGVAAFADLAPGEYLLNASGRNHCPVARAPPAGSPSARGEKVARRSRWPARWPSPGG